jgi:ribosomal protein S19E (S16A)
MLYEVKLVKAGEDINNCELAHEKNNWAETEDVQIQKMGGEKEVKPSSDTWVAVRMSTLNTLTVI